MIIIIMISKSPNIGKVYKTDWIKVNLYKNKNSIIGKYPHIIPAITQRINGIGSLTNLTSFPHLSHVVE